MCESIQKAREIALQFIRVWTQPHRRAAFLVLLKAGILLGALSEVGWQLNTRYFAPRLPQLPLSLAWSMLTVIFVVTYTQVLCSVGLKLLSTRRGRKRSAVSGRIGDLLGSYLADQACPTEVKEEIARAAKATPYHFETCVGLALLQLRGSLLKRLCDLPQVLALRDQWIERSRKGDDEQRRRAVEQLGLLRDSAAIPALENALDDNIAAVVASAVRGLLQMPSYAKHDELVRSLPNRSYLVRVLTACESADDAARLAVAELPVDNRTLDLARLRGRAIGEGDLRPLLDAANSRSRSLALRLVPLAPPDASPTRAVMAALLHRELEMGVAAVEVAARLRLSRAIPVIADYAKTAKSLDVARASCSALAALGEPGLQLLRQMSAAGEAGDAPAEALGAVLAASIRGGA